MMPTEKKCKLLNCTMHSYQLANVKLNIAGTAKQCQLKPEKKRIN
jgi:hypothetical protein